MKKENLNLLWKPSNESKSKCHLISFIDYCCTKYSIKINSDYNSVWKWSVENPINFWESVWDFSNVIGNKSSDILINPEKMQGAIFFPGATLNYAENILSDPNNSKAVVSIREDGKKVSVTKENLKEKVMSMAGWLKDHGVGKGDRVAAYMPNCLETVITMLATSSLGGVFSSCSTDFGVAGVLDRFNQINPKVLVTVDGYLYNGKKIVRTNEILEIVKGLPSLKETIILKYLNEKTNIPAFENFINFEEVYKNKPIETFTKTNFNDPLYIVFSSGTTGAPKCIVHGIGGVLLQHAKEHKLQADIKVGDIVFYFSTCGWMMWNWLVGALFSKATIVLYEGSPFFNGPETLWELAESEKITFFGTSAKYIDAVRKSGYQPKRFLSLKSLKSLCSTGSPLSNESFDFINKNIKANMQIGSISGGTDILSCFVLNNPLDNVYSGEIQCRGLGMSVEVFDENGKSIINSPGELVCTKPFPSMPIYFWNDENGEKYKNAYFNFFKNIWRHGDWAKLTDRGSMVIYGRSDATLNPGGVRIGTAEIYKEVESFNEVNEALVIGQNWDDDIRVVLFLKLSEGNELNENLINKIKLSLRTKVSPRHVPAKIISVKDIPRTRSGKITELAVRDVIHGKTIKNAEALANPEALRFFSNLKELKE